MKWKNWGRKWIITKTLVWKFSLFHLDANILASIYENANRRHYNKKYLRNKLAFWTEVSHYDIVESLLKHFSKLEIKHDNIRVSPVQITCFVVINRQIFKTTCSVIIKCKMYTLWDISFPLQVQQLKSKIFTMNKSTSISCYLQYRKMQHFCL